MDSFELSKIVGAILSALLLIFGSNVIIDSRLTSSRSSHNVGYILPSDISSSKKNAGRTDASSNQLNVSEAGVSSDAKNDNSPFDAKSVLAMLASVKPEEGEAVFKKCAACHVAKKEAPSGVAPNLWGILNRAKGTQPDFSAKYSEAMKAKGGDWTYDELALFLHKPKDYLPGTKMAFAGLTDPKDIASVISYLRTLSDQPSPLPK